MLQLMYGCGRGEHVADPLSSGGTSGGASASGGVSSLGGSNGLAPSADCKLPIIRRQCEDGFCRIEPGCFIMGAPDDEPLRARDSTRQVQVTLTHAFQLGQTELTRADWEGVGFAQPLQQATGETIDCLSPDCPQPNVSFYDALAYANRLSELRGLAGCYVLSECTGEVGNGLACASIQTSAPSVYECRGYRLPSEAEWEYAARGGTTTPFFTGGITYHPDLDCYDEPSLNPIGWYCINSNNRAHPVAQKLANPWGLYDTAGNVLEWCNDEFKAAGYGTGPLVDPSGMRGDPSNLTIVHALRVLRSGSFPIPAYSSKSNWHVSLPDNTFSVIVGVRLARTLF
ncbi:MAG: formylglycine-generating enzyme family protein [Myxococcota bacterium]